MADARRLRNVRPAVGICLGLGLLLVTSIMPPVPRLVWNVSASAPPGLYHVRPGAPVRSGDMVVAWLPPRVRALAAERHYLSSNVPLVKRIAAGPGDRVCAIGEAIFVNGRHAAQRRSHDGQGRRMPSWTGCLRLGDAELFLLMEAPASFDGRYFGVSSAGDVVGKARLIWAR